MKSKKIELAEVENFRRELENLWNQLDASSPDYEQVKGLYTAKAREFMGYIGVPIVDLGVAGSITVANKSTGLAIYALSKTTAEDVAKQLKRRENAENIWSKIPIAGRQAYIREVTALRKLYAEAFALALIIDTGKPYWQAISEGIKATDFYIWAGSDEVAREATRIYAYDKHGKKISDIAAIADDEMVTIVDRHTEPLPGGASVIESLNYTEALAANDTALAPVAGNIVAIKPPSDAPGWTFLELKLRNEAFDIWSEKYAASGWAKYLAENGVDIADKTVITALKQGAFTIGIGHEAKYHLYSGIHRTVGSAETGPMLESERLGFGNRGKVINELSGINPHVAMPEAKDAPGGLEKFITDGHAGIASNTGARCTAPYPLMVHMDVYAEAKKLAVAKFTKGTEAGNPFQKWADDEKAVKYTKNGAIMKKVFYEESVKWLKEGKALGFVKYGGERLLDAKHPDAYHMKEAVLVVENPNAAQVKFLRKLKPFGPVTALVGMTSLEQGIEICRDLPGLSMGFYGSIDDFAKFRANVNHGSAHYYEPPKDKSPDGIHAQKGGAGKGVTGGMESVSQYRLQRSEPSNTTLKGCMAKIELEKLKSQGRFI